MSTVSNGSLNYLRRVIKEAGGTLESDGCGGYEAVAPEKYRWKAAEVRYYPLPLNEVQGEERREMIAEAGRMLGEGIEADTEEERKTRRC